jgi:hypothetical protein
MNALIFFLIEINFMIPTRKKKRELRKEELAKTLHFSISSRNLRILLKTKELVNTVEIFVDIMKPQ